MVYIHLVVWLLYCELLLDAALIVWFYPFHRYFCIIMLATSEKTVFILKSLVLLCFFFFCFVYLFCYYCCCCFFFFIFLHFSISPFCCRVLCYGECSAFVYVCLMCERVHLSIAIYRMSTSFRITIHSIPFYKRLK